MKIERKRQIDSVIEDAIKARILLQSIKMEMQNEIDTQLRRSGQRLASYECIHNALSGLDVAVTYLEVAQRVCSKKAR